MIEYNSQLCKGGGNTKGSDKPPSLNALSMYFVPIYTGIITKLPFLWKTCKNDKIVEGPKAAYGDVFNKLKGEMGERSNVFFPRLDTQVSPRYLHTLAHSVNLFY